MKYLRLFYSALLAGIAISLGGVAYLNVVNDSAVFAALICAVGFLAVATFDLHLYTDKIGYFTVNEKRLEKKIIGVFVILVGNLLGASGMGLLTNIAFGNIAKELMLKTSNSTPIEVLIKSVFCGMLMFISAHGYRRQSGGFAGCTIVALSVVAFVLCGFEHFTLNMFFFAAMKVFDVRTVVAVLLAIIGNTLGALIFSELYALKKDDDAHRHHRHHHH